MHLSCFSYFRPFVFRVRVSQLASLLICNRGAPKFSSRPSLNPDALT